MNKYKVQELLTKRFYITNQQGATYKYYDTELQEDGLLESNIVGLVCHEHGIDYKEAKEMVKHTEFRALAPTAKYRPDKPEVFCDSGIWFKNRWVAPTFKEREGNRIPYPDLFIEHLNLALGGTTAAYVIDVLAHRLQNPYDNKPHTAFYFYHEVGGMGKSLFVDTLRHVLGEHSVKSLNTIKRLDSMSSSELWNTSWLCIEEADVTKGSSVYDNLKAYVTSDVTESDAKYKGFSKVETPAMLMLMSNRPPTFIEPNDRRFLVNKWHIDFPDDKAKTGYFKGYIDWLESGGYEQIHFHLKHKGNIRPLLGVDVPMTDEKKVAMSLGASSVVTELKDLLLDNPDSWFFNLDAFSATFDNNATSSSQQKHRLIDAGLEQDDSRRLVSGKQHRLWKRAGAYVTRGSDGSMAHYNGSKKLLKEAALLR